MKEIHSLLQRDINAKLGGGNKLISASLQGNIKINNNDDNYSNALRKAENLNLVIEGGDYTNKDFRKWIRSFNLDNLQIIEYKSLQPIYCFIPGLESKLSICLQNYEDIVLKEIYTLMEKDFIPKEKELFEGSSDLNNFWKVGITQESYKGFIIYKRKIIKNLQFNSNSIENEENMKQKISDIISGEIPDGFIICGWILKTNANSNYYDIVANWKRKKTVGIIGNECFKFKVDLNVPTNFHGEVEVEWSLNIFCIHTNFLISENWNFTSKKYNHYFVNCDCTRDDKNDCYYYNFYNNKNFIKKEKKDFIIKKTKKNFGNLFG